MKGILFTTGKNLIHEFHHLFWKNWILSQRNIIFLLYLGNIQRGVSWQILEIRKRKTYGKEVFQLLLLNSIYEMKQKYTIMQYEKCMVKNISGGFYSPENTFCETENFVTVIWICDYSAQHKYISNSISYIWYCLKVNY